MEQGPGPWQARPVLEETTFGKPPLPMEDETKANYSATEKELALAAMASKKNDTLQVC